MAAEAGVRRLAPVRVRITVLASLVVGGALVVAAAVAVVLLRDGLVHGVAGTGPRRAAEIAALAQAGPLPDPLPPLDTPRLTLLQLLDDRGRVVDASAPLRGRGALASPGDGPARVRSDLSGLAPGRWLLEPTAAVVAGRPATVVVVTSLDGLAHPVTLLTRLLLVGLPLLIGLVAYVAWVVVGRALRPVEAMRVEVAGITGGQLDRRVPVPSSSDEVGRLGRTLNDMLDRLQAADERQRHFVSDASHELRTPLANLRTALEVSGRTPTPGDWPALSADLQSQVLRMQAIVDDLVELARRDEGLGATAAPVDLRSLVLATVADRAGGSLPITLDLGEADAIVRGNPLRLTRVLANLLDNAARHGRSAVAVSLWPTATAWHVAVDDDGPGIEPADRERVFERFVRLDEHRARGDGGTGLGLAIVQLIVHSHGGTVHVLDSPLGGARLLVRLPRP